jgi:hypothetical protein
LRKILFLLLLIPILASLQSKSTYAQRCELPEGYLADVSTTFDQYGTAFTQVDVENPAALATFFIALSAVRQSYEERAVDLPPCGLRLHSMLVALLSNMQDTIGTALAILADPVNEAEYLTVLQTSNARLQLLAERIEAEIDLIQRPPILSVRYLNVQAANVRAAPDADAETLGVIEYGTRIEVLSLDLDQFDRRWYEFYFGDQTGWVLGDLTVTEPPPEFTPTPAVSPTPENVLSPTNEVHGENADG